MKKKIFYGSLLAMFLLCSLIIFLTGPKHVLAKQPQLKLVNVEITGEVLFPGKYRLVEGSTINDLVNFAGGYTDMANLKTINLNYVLEDKKSIHIDKINLDELDYKPRFNINEIDFKQLIQIPGITENRAISILTYRKKIGRFVNIRDLKNVDGIGEATFNKIKDFFICK